MHELTFANKIIEDARKQGDVIRIEVEVGDLAHLPASDLKDALCELVDWKIEVVEKKGWVKCPCGFEGEPEILDKKHDYTLFQCPKCGAIPEIIDGEEIILKEVEVKD
ncbi:MAG: hydrogenase maturation nickel metallochaperone HypA [Nanoarchaeota archaeon]|nr:hydrogenase maturation nickel metallochaperone HypA [Nanoarchaeota archaeon]